MLIAIVGTRASGKDSVHKYLVDKGFTPLALAEAEPDNLRFSTTSEMLAHVTRHWTDHFVTMDLGTRALLAPFMRRPFFMLISVDAPILLRYRRARSKFPGLELLDFIQEHDKLVHGFPDTEPEASPAAADSLHAIRDLVHLHIDNAFDTVPDLHFHLEKLDLLDPSHLRPGWDAYFMTIASLASHRSNCMKRRVGAVLVDVRGGNRIIATGYNGTPRGLTNCNAGGCPRCNTGIESVECICLHAEENALLEAGRERVGPGAVLYCNTCPCLKCTVKIIQTGVSTVVYNLSYKVDDASAALFKESGVELRRYNPNHKHYLPTIDAPGLRMVNA
ncbi:cytidine deaminase-like protein [Schizophyllum commune]